jgi:hypothetical protein
MNAAATQQSMTATEFFEASLAKVESKSIREWATSERNRPIWIDIAQQALDNGKSDTDGFAAYIVVTAMG